MSNGLPHHSIGTTGPTGKIHLGSKYGVKNCDPRGRRPGINRVLADVSPTDHTKGGILRILTTLDLDADRLCARCFPAHVRDAFKAAR
ncbi:hypothetical protein [Pseudonocardia sp.]|uniref:hypothetical protein n=1 Tax=Pseudonocardia sp. TaxID=60912 RepID=UPI002601D0B4|nr:hypothetical protein [Pseudonocardia sp.]MCW2719025.1 hypothetical protein [Pseudonocardia sp.]